MLGTTARNRCAAHRLHRERWEVIRLLKKVITWAIVLFIIYYVATEPSGAAGFVHSIFNGLHSAATSMAEFVNSL